MEVVKFRQFPEKKKLWSQLLATSNNKYDFQELTPKVGFSALSIFCDS